MTKLETIRQKIEAERNQQEQREAEKESIRKQISVLDGQINSAINDGDNNTAEKLITKQNELRTKLDIAERISRHKETPDRYSADLKGLCAEKAAELQPKADKLYDEMEKAHLEYLKKKVALGKILYEGASFRMECFKLAGIGPAYENDQYPLFASVKHNQLALDVYFRDKEAILQMEPEFFIMAGYANNYGCFNDR